MSRTSGGSSAQDLSRNCSLSSGGFSRISSWILFTRRQFSGVIAYLRLRGWGINRIPRNLARASRAGTPERLWTFGALCTG
jgi:hypothetical protein